MRSTHFRSTAVYKKHGCCTTIIRTLFKALAARFSLAFPHSSVLLCVRARDRLRLQVAAAAPFIVGDARLQKNFLVMLDYEFCDTTTFYN